MLSIFKHLKVLILTCPLLLAEAMAVQQGRCGIASGLLEHSCEGSGDPQRHSH